MDKTQQSGDLRNKLLAPLSSYKRLAGRNVLPDDPKCLCGPSVGKKLQMRANHVVDDIIKLYQEYPSKTVFEKECPYLVPIVSALAEADYQDGFFDFLVMLEMANNISPVPNVSPVSVGNQNEAPAQPNGNPFQGFTPS